MKEKRETTKITTPDGMEITIIAKQHDIDALKEDLEDCIEDYNVVPEIKTYVRMIHAQALYDEARGDLVGAADGLKKRLDIDYDVEFPEHDDFVDPCQLEFRRAAAYLASLYLKLGRIEDALDWGEASFETAHDNFYGTEEIAYAMSTYANCFMAAGQDREATAYYEAALEEIAIRLNDLEELAKAVIYNMEQLKKK